MKATLYVVVLTVIMQFSAISQEENTNASSVVSDNGEFDAWQKAEKCRTLNAFRDFYVRYPHSMRIKAVTGTLRARYWFKINDPQRLDGVIVSVAGINIIKNLSLEEALSQNVIGSREPRHGETIKAKGRTFNYVYLEATDGGTIPLRKNGDTTSQSLVITPKDYLGATIFLNAEGTGILTWDLSKATVADYPNNQPTFIRSAAVCEPFNSIPNSVSKKYTPETQDVSFSSEYK